MSLVLTAESGTALRDLGSADLATVMDLARAAYGDELPATESMIAADLALQPHRARNLGLFEHGVLAAMARVLDQAGVWHVIDVCTHPHHQRRGLATRVLGELIERERATDHGGWTLEVRASNAAAAALYRSLGFRDHGLRPGYYDRPTEDARIMWRAPGSAWEAGMQDGWRPAL
jgi:ribosomal-protein-alanine N-acetyltransferase